MSSFRARVMRWGACLRAGGQGGRAPRRLQASSAPEDAVRRARRSRPARPARAPRSLPAWAVRRCACTRGHVLHGRVLRRAGRSRACEGARLRSAQGARLAFQVARSGPEGFGVRESWHADCAPVPRARASRRRTHAHTRAHTHTQMRANPSSKL